MFCPACGVATSEEQKFCRACGMHLEVVYHLVAEHAQAESVAPVLPEKRPAHQTVGRFLSVRGGALFIVLAFTLLLVLASADVPARLWNPLWSQLAMGAFGLIFAGLCLFRLPWPYRKLFTRLRRETTQLELIDTTKLPAEILASQGEVSPNTPRATWIPGPPISHSLRGKNSVVRATFCHNLRRAFPARAFRLHFRN